MFDVTPLSVSRMIRGFCRATCSLHCFTSSICFSKSCNLSAALLAEKSSKSATGGESEGEGEEECEWVACDEPDGEWERDRECEGEGESVGDGEEEG